MAQPKAKCLECSRRVDIGSFTGTYALHNNKSGDICSGSCQPIPGELLPLENLRSSKKPSKKKKSVAKEASSSIIAQFEVNQRATIRRSLAEEREVREAQITESGSVKSVRSISAGLPTLGKKL